MMLSLGYSKKRTIFFKDLINNNCDVCHTKEGILSAKGFNLVLFYGHQFILNREIIKSYLASIIKRL